MSEMLPKGKTKYLISYPDEYRDPFWQPNEEVWHGAWWLARGFFVKTHDSAPEYEDVPLFMEPNVSEMDVALLDAICEKYKQLGSEIIFTPAGFRAAQFEMELVVKLLLALKIS